MDKQQALVSLADVLRYFGAGRKEEAVTQIREQGFFDLVTPSEVVPFMRTGRTKRPLKEAVAVLYGAFLAVKHNIPTNEALVYGQILGEGVEEHLGASDIRASLDAGVASAREEAEARKAKRVEAGKTLLPALAQVNKHLVAVHEAMAKGADMPPEAEAVLNSIRKELEYLGILQPVDAV